LAEVPPDHATQIALRLWAATQKMLLIVEPGTPQGFDRIKRARNALIRAGAHILAPCTHANTCPMMDADWCHFSVRLPRSRAHMHAKAAILPYEDEPFSFIAASRVAVSHDTGRILARPVETKFDRSFKLCTAAGLENRTVPTRNKLQFKRVRKTDWGDTFPASGDEKK
jgi:ribosomal protein RSM22 (predicted rRNA methylase)